MFFVHDMVQFYAALADENRLRLLHLLKDGELCVCYLQEVLQTNQPRISRHLAYLRNAGLVEARRDGKWMHYRLSQLDGKKEELLQDVLKQLASEPQMKADVQRLEKICCCPARYGISSPEK